MPFALLTAYAEMQPRLDAERQLEMVHAVAAGSGQMKTADRKKWLEALQRQAELPRRSKHEAASLEELQKLGKVSYG